MGHSQNQKVGILYKYIMYATNFVPIETPHRLKRLKLDPEMFNDFSYKQQVNRMVDAVIKSNLQRD